MSLPTGRILGFAPHRYKQLEVIDTRGVNAYYRMDWMDDPEKLTMDEFIALPMGSTPRNAFSNMVNRQTILHYCGDFDAFAAIRYTPPPNTVSWAAAMGDALNSIPETFDHDILAIVVATDDLTSYGLEEYSRYVYHVRDPDTVALLKVTSIGAQLEFL